MSARLHVSPHPLVREKLTRLRDERTPPTEFRHLVNQIATLVLYEATADLALTDSEIRTPLAAYRGAKLKETVGLVPVLRAGIGMVEAALDLVPEAQVWHIGLFRDERTLRPIEYYNKLPSEATAQVCLVLDPMLATGGSATATVDVLKRWGAKRIPEGVATLSSAHPDVPIHIAALDDHLNEKGYIVPGLGDAGDRQFGT
ncbi:MAG: uracil phosphoribosyltransferase [Chloroflexi bacterium]|nr:uracil phosphoribosyltransferase [Chloroflexota bacterium]